MACLESAVFSIDLDDDNIIYQEGGVGNDQPPKYLQKVFQQAAKAANNATYDLKRQREQENLNKKGNKANEVRHPTNHENEERQNRREERIKELQRQLKDKNHKNSIQRVNKASAEYKKALKEQTNKTEQTIKTTKETRDKKVTYNTRNVDVKGLISGTETKEEEAKADPPLPPAQAPVPAQQAAQDSDKQLNIAAKKEEQIKELAAQIKEKQNALKKGKYATNGTPVPTMPTPPPPLPTAPPPAKSPPPTPPPGGAEEKTATSLQNVAKELFDTEHTYVNNLKLITDHLQRYKNVGIQIRRQNIVSKSFNPILERALRYLIQMYQVHNFSYIGNNVRDEEIQKNDYVNRFLTLEESQNIDAFNWLSNIKTDGVKELYIKYNFIFDYLNESDVLQTNENSKEIKGSRLDLNSFLIMPIQRFPRYGMIFDGIIKHANEKDKNVFQTHQSRISSMLTDINDFKIYFTKTKFETLYEEGQKFINTHFPNGLYSFPFHLYDVITADDEEKINAESSELDNSKLALSADDEENINAEIFAKQTKVENMKKDFLEIICNGVLASSIIKGKVNESKCETKTNHKTMFYDIRAAHTDLQKQLKELETSNDESLFEVYIREVNKKVTGNGCQDILMKLIVLEQASTIYIARCIKSKYPTVLFSYRKDSKFSGLWEKDKKLLQEDKIRTVKKGGGETAVRNKLVRKFLNNDTISAETYIDNFGKLPNSEISGRPKGVEETKSNNQFAEKQFIEMEKKFLTPPEGDPRKPPDNNLLKGLQNYPEPNQDLIDNYEKEHGAYKKNSMVYQLIKEQMKVNKEILGFQPEITNLDAMFDFKKIDQIVDDFDTSKMDQKILSKYFDESVQLKHAMDVEVLKQLMEQAEHYFKDKLQNQDEHKKMIHGIIKNHKNFLVTEFNKKDLKINHSILYATDNNREKLFQTCMPSILNH